MPVWMQSAPCRLSSNRVKALAVLLLACVPAVSSSAVPFGGSDATSTDATALAGLQAQLDVGEYADVAASAERMIAALEANVGRYHVALTEPLTLLGDALMGMDDSERALQAYDRAKHIVRIDDGVQGLAQIDLLYREADAFVALHDRQSANDRHEFAYSLKLRAHGEGNPLLVPGLYKLAEWYRYHYKFRPSQILYEKIIDIAKNNYPAGDRRTIAALRDYADTYRQRRFGTREPGRGGFSAWPPGHPKDPPWQTKSTFRRGRDILREVLTLTKEAPSRSDAELAAAMVELADWNLLHYEYGVAMRHYRRAWALLESDADALAATFEKPTPLYLRLPADPAERSSHRGTAQDGVVRLALNVTHRGDVVGRRTLLAEPYNLMEFKLRKAAKQARYRPAFHGGNPVPRQGLKIEFKYRYYPGDMALAR